MTKLRELPTSVVSGTREKKFFSLDIFFKIISPKRLMSPGTPAIDVV